MKNGGALIAVLFSLVAASAHAAREDGLVTAIRPVESGNVWLEFSVACNDDTMWVIPADHPNKSAMVSAALAAVLSGAPVTLGASNDGEPGRCQVDWLQVGRP